jgi:hypothetical protein
MINRKPRKIARSFHFAFVAEVLLVSALARRLAGSSFSFSDLSFTVGSVWKKAAP